MTRDWHEWHRAYDAPDSPLARRLAAYGFSYGVGRPEITPWLPSDARTFVERFRTLDSAGWERTGVYNYPTPQLRAAEWIGIHTTHELLHHRYDLK